MRNTPSRSIKTSLGIFLLDMKSGLPNKTLTTIFNISKSSLRRAILSVRKTLMSSIVDVGIKAQMQMPSFLNKGDKQLSADYANSSRLVSKASVS